MDISTMEYYLAINRHEILLQLGESPKHYSKENWLWHKREHAAWFYLCEVLELAKLNCDGRKHQHGISPRFGRIETHWKKAGGTF